jgi:LysR family hydrogen peroxide-inducible transcriptional activator
MLLDNDHCYSNQILEACPGLAKNRDVQLGNSLETIRNMVASNLGISVLPKSATVSGYDNPLVKTIPFSEPKPYRRVALAYRKSTVKKDAINYIIKSIQKINLYSILN